MHTLSASEYVQGILSGDKPLIARAITMVESNLPAHEILATDILNGCISHAGNSVRIGVTGVPGVGKSTFIEALGNHILTLGKRIAVLAIDPTSQKSKGSILGDKTRMEKLSVHPDVFIRPTPAGINPGGVAAKTRETMVILEAAGYEVIIVETVGVGQSEVAVHSMTDIFLLLMIAGAGDELQGIKRGIMEMADIVAINKADGNNLERIEVARMDVQRALHLFPKTESGWQPAVISCSSTEGRGIAQIWDLMQQYSKTTNASGYFSARRKQQQVEWFESALQNEIIRILLTNKENIHLRQQYLLDVTAGKVIPSVAARNLASQLFRNSR